MIVEIIPARPLPPPTRDVVITLSEEEARFLVRSYITSTVDGTVTGSMSPLLNKILTQVNKGLKEGFNL